MSSETHDRVILHCDCNSFFASVETALNPAYAGVPMAVCGSVEARHGIVLAKNDLAKKFGIQTAETVASAKKKCPSLVIAPPHHSLYMEYSRRVNAIYARYTDRIEPFGIDESWLDVTQSRRLHGNGLAIAEKIRQDVKHEIGITVSIGVSFNKAFAKFGSDYKKPDAITVIDRGNFKKIVWPYPADSLLFVGRKSRDILTSLGIVTVGDLAAANPDILRLRFGKNADLLLAYARGEDDSPVEAPSPDDRKSISNGFTFRHDLVSREECRIGIEFLCEDIGTTLRRLGMKCTTVVLTVKDEMLHSVQHQKPQSPATDLSDDIAKTACEILDGFYRKEQSVRMLTVGVSGLVKSENACEQLDLFDTDAPLRRQKEKDRETTVDSIRKKFGSDSIVKAAVIGTDLGIYDNKK